MVEALPPASILTSLALAVLRLNFPGCHAIGNTETQLLGHLLKDYDVSARPVLSASEAVVVKLDIALQQVINLDERRQELFIKVWMRYSWHDDLLKWNSSDFDNIQSVRIVPTRIWRPDITLYDSLNKDPNDNDAKLFPAAVYNDGTVNWHVPMLIVTNCDVDVRYYPWDEQYCVLKFGSWTYDGSKLDLLNATTIGDLAYYKTSSEWNIINFSVKRNNVLYNCCPYPYPDVTYTIHLRRKPMYYLFNLILPAVFITITTVLVFYLPPESGEKVSLGVTVLLALTVFLLLVAESVPKSEIVPLIGRYFESTIILMALSSALTVLTLNIHHRGLFGNQVPKWIKVVVLDWAARPLCLKKKVDANLSKSRVVKECVQTSTYRGDQLDKVLPVPGDGKKPSISENDKAWTTNVSQGDSTLSEILKVLHRLEEEKKIEEKKEACKTDWMLVAAVIDRFLLYLFFLLTIVTTASILSDHPVYTQPPIA